MKERPILFSAPMVRAILDGKKTQTRRVVKPQPNSGERGEMVDLGGTFGLLDGVLSDEWTCPFGVAGDRLWVRETWAAWAVVGSGGIWRVRYNADGLYEDRHSVPFGWIPPRSFRRDKPNNAPSIFMPRWASRITLEITSVRVERLQEITIGDALAEGADGKENCANACDWYLTLWNGLNRKRGFGWEKNPWVWVIEFKRVANA